MLLVFLAAVFATASAACAIVILAHALGRSVGTFVMVLCIPCYLAVYAFTQFENRHKPLIATAYLGFMVLAAAFAAVGLKISGGVGLGPT